MQKDRVQELKAMPTRSHALVACHKQFGMLSALPFSVSQRVKVPAWLAKMVESIHR